MHSIETAQINHHIEVFDDEGIIRVKLTDDSGEGHFVDASGIIKHGHFLTPLENGKHTACSADEVAYILSWSPMSIEVMDDMDRVHVMRADMLPEDKEDLSMLLRYRAQDVRRINCELQCGDIATAPAWYTSLQAAFKEPTRTRAPSP